MANLKHQFRYLYTSGGEERSEARVTMPFWTEQRFFGGRWITSWPKTEVRASQVGSGPIEDVPWTHSLGLFVSPRALEVLLAAGCGPCIQYFEVPLRLRTKKIVTYFMVNCHRMIDCHNRKQSDLRVSGEVMSFSKFVIDPTMVPPECPMFVPLNNGPCIVITEALRDAIVKSGITGFQISPELPTCEEGKPLAKRWQGRPLLGLVP
ncbi:MAG: hypothetical protein KGS45_11795 [Planctomycetes bacterium]|nr:hypothetical protein [Planctomycetota bacterium]